MSEEHARQFIHTVEQDPALQQKIDAFDPATSAHEIVKLGAGCKLHFSVEEFDNALKSHLQVPDHEITEEQLDSVSGGLHYTGSTPVHGPQNAQPDPNITIPPGAPYPVYWVKHGTF